MGTVVIIPDSFKGTMSSAEVCQTMAAAWRRHLPGWEVVCLPVADGGEGSVDAFLQAVGGQKVPVRVTGPLSEPVDAFYGLLPDQTAVVEMAAAAGLPLVEGRRAPLDATTYGVGELMLHAVQQSGARRLVVGLGGSATTDMGTGAAAACGVGFWDADGAPLLPCGGADLARIARVSLDGLDPALRACPITVMCDIDNPLYGPRGAAAVFGPQKGADEAGVAALDAGLRQAAQVVGRDLGLAVASLPGAGAAGGMGAGMVAFFGAQLRQGIDVVLDAVGFDQVARSANWVITGEGCLDAQSLSGKAVVGVARRARRLGVPVLAVCGDVRDGFEGVYAEGVAAAFSINHLAVDFATARPRARHDLDLAMDNLARLIALAGHR